MPEIGRVESFDLPRGAVCEVECSGAGFPGLKFLPARFTRTEEFDAYGAEHSEPLNYLKSVEESTYQSQTMWREITCSGMGEFHAIAWHQQYYDGRAFYTGLSYLPAPYDNTVFLRIYTAALTGLLLGKASSNSSRVRYIG